MVQELLQRPAATVIYIRCFPWQAATVVVAHIQLNWHLCIKLTNLPVRSTTEPVFYFVMNLF